MMNWKKLLCAIVVLTVCEGKDTEAGKADIKSALEIHNKARKDVRAPALKWSGKLASDAQAYANLLARKGGRLVHAKTGDQGGNLFMGARIKNPATAASQAWYNEIKDYKHAKLSKANFHGGKPIGHYTQMVWKSTRQVGIGMAVGENGRVYVVARYSPRGNVMGKYPY
jgi:pathogenesis-related protein 1